MDGTSSLIPGVDNLIGVRIPTIRRIAKNIVKDKPLQYLEHAEDIYFEEIMLQGLVIGQLKEARKTILEQTALFIPKINNWSVCDSFCNDLKMIRENKEPVWKFLIPYLQSENAYEIRFGVVTMLFYYIDETYLYEIFKILDSIKHPDYYVKMAVAWSVSTCFTKFPTETMTFLKNNELDDQTFNKSLQKIKESLKVSKDTKEIIKSLKR